MYDLYSLIDPRNNTIAYIGYTKRPEQRFNEHLKKAITSKAEKNTYKSKWIRKLYEENKKPIYKVLLRTNSIEEVKLLEIDYIAYYKQIYKLKNGTKGGDGTTGYIFSLKDKKNMSLMRSGKLRPNCRFFVEILHSKTFEYKNFKDKTEAAKFIGCSENAIMSVSCGHRKKVYNWYVNLINRNGGTLSL